MCGPILEARPPRPYAGPCVSSKRSSPEPADGAAPVEPPWWRPPRPGRRRQPLSRQAIVEAALRIIDRDGADGLTVRRLGEELNTGSATLYWHIGSKDELGEMVYDHVMGALELPEPDPTRWREQLSDMGLQAYRLLVGHRDLVRFSIGRVPVGPNMLGLMEWALALGQAAGLPDETSSYFGDIFGRYIDVSVLEANTPLTVEPEAIGRYFASLPADRFPHVAALASVMFIPSDEERFTLGLDLLLRGLASWSADHPATPPGRGAKKAAAAKDREKTDKAIEKATEKAAAKRAARSAAKRTTGERAPKRRTTGGRRGRPVS